MIQMFEFVGFPQSIESRYRGQFDGVDTITTLVGERDQRVSVLGKVPGARNNRSRYKIRVTLEPDLPKLDSDYEWIVRESGEYIRSPCGNLEWWVNRDGAIMCTGDRVPADVLRGFKKAGMVP